MDAPSKDDGASESDALSNVSQTSQDEQKSQVPQTDNNAPKNPSPTHDAPEQLPQEAAESSTQNRTPLPPSRPPHTGWVGTGIPMAICDFCDKRSQGTLQRCSVCKIAVCKECLDAGKLDSRHSLDPDSVRWDLHVVQPADKKPKRTRATMTTTTTTTTTRARGAGRARARGGRATRTVSTRASAVVPAAESPAPTLASHDENMGDVPEQDDELIIIQEHFSTPPARPRPEPMEEVHQLRPRSPMPQLLPSGQPSFIEPPVEPRRGPVPLQPRPLQPTLPRPSPFQQARVPLSPRSQAPFPGNAYGSQPRGQDLRGPGSSQGPVAREERGHRYHPYSRTSTPHPPPFQYDDQVLGTLGMGRQGGGQGAYSQPQPPRPEHASLQPNLPPLYPAGSEGPPGNHREPFRGEYSLPPLRELALYPPRPPTPAHGHLPPPQHPQHYGHQQQHHNQPQQLQSQQLRPQHHNQPHYYSQQQQHYQQQNYSRQQPPPRQASADALVQTLSKQLEADALATHRDYPAWPLDQCLRHELDRAWSRRGAQLSLLRAVQGPNGVEDTDVAFRILINANYMASVLLQIGTPNAAHQWLVDTKKQLVEHGFLAPLPADSQPN
ncbi:hypothetical protein QQZ08_000755 [Neonectria magnoliae]|uniref:Uncharacterized protein n=1 Tax=Neonectria magnoliae TaxID=2732573 RepID=A0ABR1IG21_9HYPO